MKIYTRAGDSGETGLFGGERVRKDVARVEAYGTLDELNAVIGLAVTDLNATAPDLMELLVGIQSELFDVGAELATPADRDGSRLAARLRIVAPAQTAALEEAIDRLDTELDPLASFILPGGSRAAATLHLARTIARRAERRVVTLAEGEPINTEILRYLNRLSDLLFVLARVANRRAGRSETVWRGRP